MDNRGTRKPSGIKHRTQGAHAHVERVEPQLRQAQPRPVQPQQPQPRPVQQQPVYRQQPSYQHQGYQRPVYEGAARRSPRIWPWVLALIAALAISIPLIVMGVNSISNPQPASNTSTTSEVNEQAAESDGTEGEEVTAASESEEEQSPSSETESSSERSSVVAAQTDLSWRDKEFAVDPDKETDWNYEPTDEKIVYLTIDDGPSERTQEVLDILDKYNCKATFFVTGIDQEYAPMIAEEYKRGHTIGLHTYSHDYAEVYSSQSAYFDDLDRIGSLVEEQIGYVPCFIRFPGGSSNEISNDYTPGIMPVLTEEVKAAGYQYYDWSGSVGDGSEHTTDEILGYGCEYDDQDNLVLLLHDSGGKQTTVEALPGIIEHYQDLGYTFKALDRESYVPQHL